MKKEYLLHLLFGLFGLMIWLLPETVSVALKIKITFVVLLLFVLVVYKEKFYFLRKYWELIISIALLSGVFLYLNKYHPELIVISILIILTSITICVLIIIRFGQTNFYKSKSILQNVTINANWNLNHWASHCASIENGKMIFSGTNAPLGSDGSNIDLTNILEVGKSYEVSCFAKSDENSKCQIQLWCHDQVGQNPVGEEKKTPFIIPSTNGEKINLIFRANYNKNIRIHLQYIPGVGRIEVNDVKIYQLIG